MSAIELGECELGECELGECELGECECNTKTMCKQLISYILPNYLL